MLNAFGVDIPDAVGKGLVEDGKREVDKHPVVATAGSLALLAGGAKGKRVFRAAGAARKMGDTDRAARLAETLKPTRSAEAGANPFETLTEQGKIVREATRENPDVRAVRPTVDHWSSTFQRSGKIKAAANSGEAYRGVRAVAHPVKAENALHAKVLTSLLDNAKPGEHPDLYRSMLMPGGHEPGDVIDFGRLASFTSQKDVAHQSINNLSNADDVLRKIPKPMQRGVLRPTTPAYGVTNTYHLPAGSSKAANLSGATGRFAQNEWLAGGKYTITGTNADGSYRLGPHHGPVAKTGDTMMTDPFGVGHVVAKAWGEVVHVGAHQVGHGIGEGARRASKHRRAFKITSDAPPGARRMPRRVDIAPSPGVRAAGSLATDLAPVAALYAGAAEINRGVENRRGANIGRGEAVFRPVRSRNKSQAAQYRTAATLATRRADKAEASPTPRPRAVARNRAMANRLNHASSVYNARAVHGEIRGNKHGPGRYDKTRTYSAPAVIGKGNPFGVDHVSKGMPEVGGSAAGASLSAGRTKKLLVGQNAPDTTVRSPGSLAKVKAKLAPIAQDS